MAQAKSNTDVTTTGPTTPIPISGIVPESDVSDDEIIDEVDSDKAFFERMYNYQKKPDKPAKVYPSCPKTR